MIVIVSVVLKVLGGGRIPGVRIKWKQLEFGKHIIIMQYFLKYSIHIKYLIRKIFGAKKVFEPKAPFCKRLDTRLNERALETERGRYQARSP